MYLIFNEALLVRSSNTMLFFKKKSICNDDEVCNKSLGHWTEYHKIDKMRGTIYFIRGNIRIQITTEGKIYFYLIDKKTFEPELENVMLNSMQCSSLMFGARVRYGISYKVSEQNFTIYTRKCFHNFKVCIDNSTYEGATGAELPNLKQYALAERRNLGIYD